MYCLLMLDIQGVKYQYIDYLVLDYKLHDILKDAVEFLKHGDISL